MRPMAGMVRFQAWLKTRVRWLARQRGVRQTARYADFYVRWLQHHPNGWFRRGTALLFILGGIFAFLPILGIWMLPVGLVVLSDDLHILRRLRRRLIVRIGRWVKDRPPPRNPPALRLRP
jgi:hypothetical protein